MTITIVNINAAAMNPEIKRIVKSASSGSVKGSSEVLSGHIILRD